MVSIDNGYALPHFSRILSNGNDLKSSFFFRSNFRLFLKPAIIFIYIGSSIYFSACETHQVLTVYSTHLWEPYPAFDKKKFGNTFFSTHLWILKMEVETIIELFSFRFIPWMYRRSRLQYIHLLVCVRSNLLVEFLIWKCVVFFSTGIHYVSILLTRSFNLALFVFVGSFVPSRYDYNKTYSYFPWFPDSTRLKTPNDSKSNG